jgi:FMN phosphatase YigB (HAD superfamily)
LGVRPGEALFLDDREINIHGARNLGMEGLVYSTPARLREDLAAWDFQVLP